MEVQAWNKEVFGNIQKRKHRALVRLGDIQRTLETHCSRNLLLLEATIKNKFELIILKGELLWSQKS